jgi:hypothetical protein
MMTELFILVIGAPTSVPGGHTHDHFWTGNLPLTLLPAQIDGPTNISFLALAATKPAPRNPSVPIGQCTPAYYANKHTAVCFSEDGALYHLILCESQMGQSNDPTDSSRTGLSNEVYWFLK